MTCPVCGKDKPELPNRLIGIEGKYMPGPWCCSVTCAAKSTREPDHEGIRAAEKRQAAVERMKAMRRGAGQ